MRFLSLFMVCFLGWLWAGEKLRLHAGTALWLGVLSAVILFVPAVLAAGPLSLVRHGRRGWRCLRQLRTLLFSGLSSPGPSRLRLRMMAGTAVLSGIRDGVFVQVVFAPADVGLRDGSLRILIAADASTLWSNSNAGSDDRTWGLRFDTTGTEADAFDGRVWLMAPTAAKLAFSREARAELSRVLGNQWDRMLLRWDPLEVMLWRNPLPIAQPEVIASAVISLTNVLSRLAASAQTIPRTLAENVTRDPCAGTRTANLLALYELDRAGALFADALAAARLDPEPRVRLCCAELVPGPWALSELSNTVMSEAMPFDVRRDAVVLLLRYASDVTAWPILKQLLHSTSSESQELAAHALRLPLNAELIDCLSDYLPELPPHLAEQVIRRFGLSLNSLNSRFEPALLGQLGSPHLAVRCAAIVALGRVGTSLSIAPLDDLLSDPVTANLAKTSLRAILARTGRGEAGQVSMAEASQEGALSVQDERGTIEVAPKRDEE